MFQLAKNMASKTEFNVFVAIPKEAPYWERFKLLLGEDALSEVPHRSVSFYSLRGLISSCLFRSCCLVMYADLSEVSERSRGGRGKKCFDAIL